MTEPACDCQNISLGDAKRYLTLSRMALFAGLLLALSNGFNRVTGWSQALPFVPFFFSALSHRQAKNRVCIARAFLERDTRQGEAKPVHSRPEVLAVKKIALRLLVESALIGLVLSLFCWLVSGTFSHS